MRLLTEMDCGIMRLPLAIYVTDLYLSWASLGAESDADFTDECVVYEITFGNLFRTSLFELGGVFV